MEKIVEKEEYETPAMTVHGSIEAITHASGGRSSLDATFPTGTPFGDLTFS